MMRVLNICVIAALVLAAADVYTIKFQSTRQAQRVAQLRLEIRRERDALAALRAEWGQARQPRTHPRSSAATPATGTGGGAGNSIRWITCPSGPPISLS